MILKLAPHTKRYLQLIATLVAIGYLLYLFSFAHWFVFPADTAWILKTGQYILNHGALPTHDLFSWTFPHHDWVLYQWLFEALAAAVLNLGGLWLCGLVTYVSAALILFYFLPRRWLDLGVPVWITFVMLVLVTNEVWFFLRPQLASFFLIIVFLDVLERYRRGASAKRLWILPPLMVLWANLHSFWFIGLLAVFCYAIAGGRSAGPLWATLFLSMLAVLVNPYDVRLIQYNLRFVSVVPQEIKELNSPFQFNTPETYTFLAYMAISWIFLCAKLRKVPLPGLLFSAVASVAALRYARFMPIAVLATWPYLGLALGNARWLSARVVSRKIAIPHLIVALAVPAVIWCTMVPNERAAGMIMAGGQLDGVIFLAKHRVPDERLYNDETMGSNLLFFGVRKVFIDNRFDMYDPAFFEQNQIVRNAQRGWQNVLQRYNVNAVAVSGGLPLRRALKSTPGWLLVYDDVSMSYWLSDSPEHRNIIRQWQKWQKSRHQ
jgi:hypothetical protein